MTCERSVDEGHRAGVAGGTGEPDRGPDEVRAVGDHAFELDRVAGDRRDAVDDDASHLAVPELDDRSEALSAAVDLGDLHQDFRDRRPLGDQVLYAPVEDDAGDLGGGRRVGTDARGGQITHPFMLSL